MRLFGPGSVSTPARVFIEILLVVIGLYLGLEVLLFTTLLVNPMHPMREYFQVTSFAAVPSAAWEARGLVHVDPTSATVSTEPWVYLTYRPVSRMFVLVPAIANLSGWGCVLLVLINLRRAFANIAAGTPFPRDNVRRIRVAGWAILGFAAIRIMIAAGMAAYMRATTTIAGRPPSFPLGLWFAIDFPLGTIAAGLAVIILAELFRAGADLQDDQALTV
jgi:uncharacterized protein YhhL (DUF1145 family)